jgi:hypothetical protein
MFCAKCGSPNPDDYTFCSKCGTPKVPAAAPGQSSSPISAAPVSPPPQAQYTGLGAPSAGQNPSLYITPQNTQPPPQAGQPYNPPPGGYAPPPGGYPIPGAYPPVKKKKTGLILALILLGLMLIISPIVILSSLDPGNNNNVVYGNGGDINGYDVGVAADGFRNNFTQIKGNGQDTVTVMVYMCGSNLESEDGCGTLDLGEMAAADLGGNVNVIIETGGCTDWKTPGIANNEVQRWQLKDGQLVELDRRGTIGMLSSDELRDFISFSAQNYPANRYAFVFWDHGGGSLAGFGSDELFPNSVLLLTDIRQAIHDSGVRFDFIGFDACLMGTIETAYMLEPYADYLVGSEETEPAYGWDYTPWLTALGENPSMDTVQLGQIIADSFIQQNKSSQGQGDPDMTLSTVALREIPYVYQMLCTYMSNASEALAAKEYKLISTAVSRTRAFADGDYDLIDIQDFVQESGLSGADTLTAALQSAVKYSDSTARSGVYGLSMYFPYTKLNLYGYAKDLFSQFGYGGAVFDFYDDFVNIMAGGQKNSTTKSLGETLTGQGDAQTDYSGYDWYDNSAVNSYTYDNIDYSELEVLWDENNQYWYLPLTEEDWGLLTGVEMQILLDDGAGYIDLGSDQYYEDDDAGNLILNYGNDNTWVAIDGQIVCYYAEATTQLDDGTTVFTGYVPAILNGDKDIEIILEWDGADADGYIAGYRLTDTYSPFGGAGTLGKGYLQFKPGDTIEFVCDYYTYDGDFDSSYLFGDPLIIGDTTPAVTYEDVGDGDVLECYMLVDVYQNYSWTETVEFSYDNN